MISSLLNYIHLCNLCYFHLYEEPLQKFLIINLHSKVLMTPISFYIHLFLRPFSQNIYLSVNSAQLITIYLLIIFLNKQNFMLYIILLGTFFYLFGYLQLLAYLGNFYLLLKINRLNQQKLVKVWLQFIRFCVLD